MKLDGGFTVTGTAVFYFNETYDLKDFPPIPVDFLEVCDKQRWEDGSYSVNLTWSETGEYGAVGTGMCRNCLRISSFYPKEAHYLFRMLVFVDCGVHHKLFLFVQPRISKSVQV